MLATIELPPKETKGRVTPVSGMTLVTPPMITNAWRTKIAVEARGQQLRETVGRHHRGLEAARGDQGVDQDHPAGAEQAEAPS